jgi:hypothetical protein
VRGWRGEKNQLLGFAHSFKLPCRGREEKRGEEKEEGEMNAGITVLWDRETPFKQYLTERGFDCEVVTPKMIAAPFFSWRASRLVLVPAGFGNSFFSGVLGDLRANRTRIMDFVKAGGALLVSGAFAYTDAYNWLPRKLRYARAEQTVELKWLKENKAAAALVETDKCMCDGYFEEVGEGWDVLLAIQGGEEEADEKAILVVLEYGAGEIIAATIHEYPSNRFFEHYAGR